MTGDASALRGGVQTPGPLPRPPLAGGRVQLTDVSCLCFRTSGNGQRAWGVVHQITAFCLGKPGAAAPVSRWLEEVLGPEQSPPLTCTPHEAPSSPCSAALKRHFTRTKVGLGGRDACVGSVL